MTSKRSLRRFAKNEEINIICELKQFIHCTDVQPGKHCCGSTINKQDKPCMCLVHRDREQETFSKQQILNKLESYIQISQMTYQPKSVGKMTDFETLIQVKCRHIIART